MATLGLKVAWVVQDLRVALETLANKDPADSRGFQVRQVLRDSLAPAVRRDLTASLAVKVKPFALCIICLHVAFLH